MVCINYPLMGVGVFRVTAERTEMDGVVGRIVGCSSEIESMVWMGRRSGNSGRGEQASVGRRVLLQYPLIVVAAFFARQSKSFGRGSSNALCSWTWARSNS